MQHYAHSGALRVLCRESGKRYFDAPLKPEGGVGSAPCIPKHMVCAMA